jgi:hypothetical protein
MRYLMMVMGDKDYEAGQPPSPELVTGMARLTDEMVQAGVLLAAEGLQPSSQGMRLKVSRGALAVTDGPFTETKELIGGYAIVQAKSKAEALQVAHRFVEVHRQAGIDDLDMEIRPLFDQAACGFPGT